MANLKSKNAKAVMTEDEKQSVKVAEEMQKEVSASTQRLELVNNLVSQKFGLDSTYSVTQFKDGDKKVSVTLENEDFIVCVAVKDSERQGIFVEK